MTVHANPIALYSSLLYYVVMSTSRAAFDLAATIREAENFFKLVGNCPSIVANGHTYHPQTTKAFYTVITCS